MSYTNSLPQDLRAAERDQYLIMVAESYATTGDLQLAQERLATWPRSQLSENLRTLQNRLANENALQASQVQQLAGALGVHTVPAPTAQPQTTPRKSASLLRNIGIAVLWVLLVLVGFVVALWLWNQWRAARATEPRPAIHDDSLGMSGIRPKRSLATSAQGLQSSASESSYVAPGETPPLAVAPQAEIYEGETDTASSLPPFISRRERARPSQVSTPESTTRQQPFPGPAATTQPAATEPTAPWTEQPASSMRPTAGPTTVKVGEYQATYHMGESDYDEMFEINDKNNASIGECGLGLHAPAGRKYDQAAALQVWLWDTNDPDTQVKVLMSEGAYRDTALRAQLAEEHAVVVARPGAEFELETYNLLLRGRVEKLDYAEQEPLYGIFAELQVSLQAYKKEHS